MTKTRSLHTAIAIMLVSTTALVAASEFALARGGGGGGGGHQGMSHTDQSSHESRGSRSGHLVMGMPSRTMGSKPAVYRGKSAYTHKKHKGCGKLIVPTAGCATPARDPVGNTRPSLPKETKQPVPAGTKPVLEYVNKPGAQSGSQPASAPAGAAASAQPAATAPAKVSITNGVTSSMLDPGKGVTVSSSGNGIINVSNGTSTVTLAGGSLTLHGAAAVTAGSGVQTLRLANGDYVVAVNAAPKGAGPSAVPPGVGLKDDVKFVGGQLAASPVSGTIIALGAVSTPIVASVAAVTGGNAVKAAKEWLGVSVDAAGVFAKGITDLF